MTLNKAMNLNVEQQWNWNSQQEQQLTASGSTLQLDRTNVQIK